MTLSFKSFHPLSGVLPDTFPEFGGDIVFRARAILQNRTDEEIFAALEIVDWIVDQSPAHDEFEAELERMVAEDKTELNGSDRSVLNSYQRNTNQLYLCFKGPTTQVRYFR